MKEYSIFICYRRSDGEKIANYVHANLNGCSHMIKDEVVILTTQLDKGSASGANWKYEYIEKELRLADFLCIVCSKDAMLIKQDTIDYFDDEITWWINNKKDSPPILVAKKSDGEKYIPTKVLNTWSNPQVTLVEFKTSVLQNDFNKNTFVESIKRGLNHSSEFSSSSNSESFIKPSVTLGIDGIYYWAKDKWGRYIEANELYAKAAGFDSPNAMLGKTDKDMPWRSLAKFFQEGDRKIMTGNELSRIHVFEKEIMVDKVADILVHENVFRDHSGRIIGVRGYFMDVTGNDLINKSIKYKMDNTGLNLGEDFGNQRLNLDEIKVFQALVRNMSKDKIASNLNFSKQHIDSIMLSLRQKLQCSKNDEIVVIAVRSGLPLKLFSVT